MSANSVIPAIVFFVKERDLSKISVVSKRGEKLAPNFGVPFFCPRCEELRNVGEDDVTGLNTPYESLMFESFQMCSLCYFLSKNSPEVIETNKKAFHERLVIKEQKIATEVKATRFRVWIRGDYSKYVESVIGKPFFSFTEQGGQKCKVLLKKEEADRAVDIIRSKLIECWVTEEEV